MASAPIAILPAYQYRPGGSVQYMLAKGDFENPDEPRHATMGFIASSDNHSARPGQATRSSRVCR